MDRVNCQCGNPITTPQRVFCSPECYRRARANRVAELFWSRVNKTETCWLWTGPVGNHGYGAVSKGRVAHRVMWEAVNGPIPPGKLLMHSCDTPLCVRPDHLSLGTDRLNSQDAKRKGRLSTGRYLVTNPRLTPDQVREIRRRSANGETQRSLASEFGMYQSSISAIVTRKWWREVV